MNGLGLIDDLSDGGHPEEELATMTAEVMRVSNLIESLNWGLVADPSGEQRRHAGDAFDKIIRKLVASLRRKTISADDFRMLAGYLPISSEQIDRFLVS